jgi:hypothetical protein
MGYLDNSTITVDAILTKRGRELLAQGRGQVGGASAFQITRFALADDEVDYDLWNPAHPLGSNYYGAVIENMPVTEAVPDETQSMKYKLITLPRGVRRIPYLQADKAALSLNPNNASQGGTVVDEQIVRVSTYYHDFIGQATGNLNPQANPFNATEGYSVLLMDNTYVEMNVIPGGSSIAGTTTLKSASVLYPGQAASSVTAVLVPNAGTGNQIQIYLTITPTAQQLTTSANKSTKLIITGVETGGRVVIPITINGPLLSDD